MDTQIYLNYFLWSVEWEFLKVIDIVYEQVQNVGGHQRDSFIWKLKNKRDTNTHAIEKSVRGSGRRPTSSSSHCDPASGRVQSAFPEQQARAKAHTKQLSGSPAIPFD